MSMNKTWAISSWTSLLILADILSGDYSQYFTRWNSAPFALHTAMTKRGLFSALVYLPAVSVRSDFDGRHVKAVAFCSRQAYLFA